MTAEASSLVAKNASQVSFGAGDPVLEVPALSGTGLVLLCLLLAGSALLVLRRRTSPLPPSSFGADEVK
jgi:hypothetical protein